MSSLSAWRHFCCNQVLTRRLTLLSTNNWSDHFSVLLSYCISGTSRHADALCVTLPCSVWDWHLSIYRVLSVCDEMKCGSSVASKSLACFLDLVFLPSLVELIFCFNEKGIPGLLICRHFVFQIKSMCNTGVVSMPFCFWGEGGLMNFGNRLSFVTGVTCQQVKSLPCIGMPIVLDG